MRLVQLRNHSGTRRVALVDGDRLRLIDGPDSVYSLARTALASALRLRDAVAARTTDTVLSYEAIYNGQSDWHLLPAFDHPEEPARCLVSGTGLTHKASADNRAAMHTAAAAITDSMRMYLAGLEGGRPAEGVIGIAPEWFYKGNGTILRGHGDELLVPAFADDGGEEPEIAGVYIIGDDGRPRRIGMAQGNEFSDHILEKKNYLYLAPSKLRTCAIGPELVLEPDFSSVPGVVSIERAGVVIWSKPVASGEAKMAHSLANLEHHHFKFPAHRRPGDAHVHFFGADAFSFGDGVALSAGDTMVIAFENFGRPLRNTLRIDRSTPEFVSVTAV